MRSSSPRRRHLILLFCGLSLLYHSNLRPVASGDSLPASIVPFALLLDGSPNLDRFAPYLKQHVWYASAVIRESGEHSYSMYPIAGPVLAAPLYLPLVAVPAVRRLPPAMLVSVARVYEKFVAVFLAAGTVVLMHLLLSRLIDARPAWILTMIFGLGTGVWSTASQALWQHTYGLPALTGSLYALVRMAQTPNDTRWQWLAGLCAGCALAVRPTNALLLPSVAVGLWLLHAPVAAWCRVYAFPLLAGALVAAWNLAVFGRLSGGYALDLGGDIVHGAAGLLVSPGRGLLIYTPVTLFALCAVAGKRYRSLGVTAALFMLMHLALVAMWPSWWGGYCWGPRMLTELIPPLMVLLALAWPSIERRRRAFAAAAIFGVLIQALGVYCYPKGRWDHLPQPVDQHPERLWDWRDNPIIRTARGGIAWEPYSILAAGLRGGAQAAMVRLKELGIQPH